MPDEAYWQTFFNADCTLDLLAPDLPRTADVVEFGCGYGTFTLAAARRTSGIVTTLDIEPELVAHVREKALAARVCNVKTVMRDFMTDGTGLPTASQHHAMIFNLLHIEYPVSLLTEARRALQPGGRLSVIHWRSDIPTPRGPSLEIRPTPDQCTAWIEEAGFLDVAVVSLESCCPYHYGVVALR